MSIVHSCESFLWFMSMTLTDLYHDQGEYLNVMYLHEVNVTRWLIKGECCSGAKDLYIYIYIFIYIDMLFHFASRGSVVHCHVILSKSKIDAGLKSQKMLLFDVFVACSRLLQDSNPPYFSRLYQADLPRSFSLVLSVCLVPWLFLLLPALSSRWVTTQTCWFATRFLQGATWGTSLWNFDLKEKRGKNERLLMQLVTPHLYGSISTVFYRHKSRVGQPCSWAFVWSYFLAGGPFASLGKTVSIEFQWFDIAPRRFSQGIPKVPQESWWHLYAIIFVMLLF